MRFSRLIPLILGIVAALPAASAGHWVDYYELDHRAVGVVSEPDGQIVNEPGNKFDGLENRVVYVGATPGDGSLLLDAKLSSFVGWNDPNTGQGVTIGTEVHPEPFMQAAGLPTFLLPGAKSIAAWYGRWNDFSNDGRIDDAHDALGAEGDEFIWRGVGSDEPGIPLLAAYLPKHEGSFHVSAWRDDSPANSLFGNMNMLVDRTGHQNSEQSWTGHFQKSVDGGLLSRVQTIVIADAIATPGQNVGYSLTDPEALYDVDTYEAVNGDVASLWQEAVLVVNATYRTASSLTADPNAFIISYRDQATRAFNQYGKPVTDDARAKIETPFAKEPNTVEDDFEGRAEFGFAGDYAGSYNSYSGYATGAHFYHDTIPVTPICVRAYARVPGTGTEQSVSLYCGQPRYETPSNQIPSSTMFTSIPWSVEPAGMALQGERTPGVLLSFLSFGSLWFDRNGDTHIGRVCNPADPAGFDAERNTCKNPPKPWPGYTDGEVDRMCGNTDANGQRILVKPIGGEWPDGAILVEDYSEATRQVNAVTWRPLDGAEEVALRWMPGCNLSHPSFTARDGIFFANGLQVGLRTESAMGIPGYKDVAKGIDIGPERVVDVDYITAAL